MEEDAHRLSPIHDHCKTCYSSRCTVKPSPPESCPLVACELQCGARFHECKLGEHHLHCPEERVPCINQTNGCPIVLPRQRLRAHLETCPASVICCTMEWNRWPLYAPERQARVPFKLANVHAKGEQLDVALALRDQRMLTKAMQAPSTTRRALRSHLTKRFPAVPINVRHIESVNPLQLPDFEGSSDEDGPPDGQSEAIKRPQIVQLLEASKRASETLTAALSLVTENQPDGNLNSCESTTQEEKISELENTIAEAKARGPARYGAPIQPPGVWINTAIPSECRTPHSIPEPPPPPPGISLQEGLALDANLEQVARYQGKPRSMYTFLCAQPFRRDEYTWHFVNVHSEVHGGLSGWLERRCPLAHYGCTYSQSRLRPAGPGSELIYSPLLESFGVKPAPHPCEDQENTATPETNDRNNGHKSLLVLPFEILRYMARYLDAYSMCNLSLTCTLLRDVCCSLLEDRGIVIQEWEPVKKDGRQHWQITYKRWLFSTAFTPISRWGFNEQPRHMSDHLRDCPYNRPECRVDAYMRPVRLPVRLDEPTAPEVAERLGRMYPDVDESWFTEPPELEPRAPQENPNSVDEDLEPVIIGGLDKLVLPQEDFHSWARGATIERYQP